VVSNFWTFLSNSWTSLAIVDFDTPNAFAASRRLIPPGPVGHSEGGTPWCSRSRHGVISMQFSGGLGAPDWLGIQKCVAPVV
jgi:hypothetical protein